MRLPDQPLLAGVRPFGGRALAAELATAGFAIYLLGGGRQLELAAHLYLAALGALAASGLVELAVRGRRSTGRPAGSGWRARPWSRRPRPPRLRSLEELEHAVDFARATAFDVHFRLRPHLVAVAEHRLAARGVSLGRDPEAARRLLGPEAWDLVRPGRPSPEDRNGRGLDLGRMERVVTELEQL